MNLWAIIPLVSFITFTVLFVVVLQQVRKRVDRAFATFIFTSGIWSLTSFMLVYDPTSNHLVFWNEMVVTAIPLVVVCYYYFVRVYNNKPGGLGLYLGSAFVLAVLVLSLTGHVIKRASLVDGYLYHDMGPWVYILAAVTIPFLTAAMYTLIKRYRTSVNPIERNRTMYLIIGSGVVIVASYITPLTPALAGLPTDHIGNLANALIIAYAIMRYQLLNVTFVARKVLTYLLMVVVLGSIYLASVIMVQTFLPTHETYSLVLLATVLVILLALLARWLRRWIEVGVDRFFYRRTYNYRQALLDFSSRMSNTINLDELAEEMLSAITKALHITQAKLLFQEIGSGEFSTQFTYPEIQSDVTKDIKFSADNPVVTWLSRNTEPLNIELIDNTPEFKGLWQVEKQQIINSNLRLLCPIKSRDKLIGILALGRKEAETLYSHEDLELVTTTARQVGVIIENAQRYSQALVMANTDGLTGLYNHRHFHERIEQEIARGSRFGAIFSLIMIDADLFKAYNDIHGHLAGDEILRRIAAYIKTSIRSMDIAFRYGGEEFAIILPETHLDEAAKVAERIRKVISSRTITRGTPITVSIGVANWPIDGVMKEEIIAASDAALYRAKQTGRNRTCLSSEVKKPGAPLIGVELEARSRALSIIYALAATVDAKDHYTYGHSKKVSDYAVALAEALNLPPDNIELIRAAGLLHDIGKIAIPDSILNKSGPLTEAEWEPLRLHPKLGVEILQHVIDLAKCLPAILHHHEHYDGSGYQAGLKGANIPLEARILAIADAYDAITSPRPYHGQLSSQLALDELRRCSGTQFDPELVDIFCKIIEKNRPKKLEIT